MRGLILGLIWLVAGAAQADVYISIDAKGSYILTNVHRPGRLYETVISEPKMSSSHRIAGTLLPAACRRSMWAA